ncbi:MAG: hypothetical protein E7048_10310 [Lentisphaerae bacterium]|nr:hypothetical protein [Lentisphaerota bacterium]
MRYWFLVIGLVLLCAEGEAYAAGSNRNKKVYSQKYGRSKITVRQVMPRSKEIAGQLPAPSEVQKAAERFFAAIDELPESFVQRTGLKYVTFLRNPTFKSFPVSGLAGGDTIILQVAFSKETVFHELFHIFDPKGSSKRWQNLNDRKFIYTGSQYYEAKLSHRKKKRKNQNLSNKTFDADFVSRYAMSNEREDRACTFASMVSEKKNFLRRTEKSPVLRKKMKYIIDSTDRKKLLGKEYWQKIFEVTDLEAL